VRVALDLGAFALVFIIKVYFKNNGGSVKKQIFRYNFDMEQKRKKLVKEYASDVKNKLSDDMLKRQRDYAFSSNGLAYRAHTYCVFTDPDFQNEVAELRQKIEALYYPKISLETSLYDEHILQADRLPIKELADKYRITLSDLAFYADGYFQLGYLNFGKDIHLEGGFKISEPFEADNLPVYVIGKYTTLEDIQRDWQYIKEYTALYQFRDDESARRRSPNNPMLIYAVFKARMKRMTFKAIYNLYEAEALPQYSGSSSQFNSEDSLERYFRKYSPKSFDNDIDTERNLAYIRELNP
jgi:hypothetical protein